MDHQKINGINAKLMKLEGFLNLDRKRIKLTIHHQFAKSSHTKDTREIWLCLFHQFTQNYPPTIANQLVIMKVQLFQNQDYIFFLMMSEIKMSGAMYSVYDHSTLRLHQAIIQFKRKETDKFILNNKLNILKQKCETNRKKAQLIESQIGKINQLKRTYRRNKEDILHSLSIEKENHKEKIERDKSLRNIAKENMKIVRNMIMRDKNEEYLKIKQKKRQNQMRITQNIQKSLHEKRQKSLQVKIREEQMRMSRTIYMQKKRLKTQRSSQIELKPIEYGTKLTDKQIEQMKLLESQMIQKYTKTNQNLTKSMLKKRKILS